MLDTQAKGIEKISVSDHYDKLEAEIARTLARHGVAVLRVSLGIVFLWFGVLKFVPGLSPAEELVTRTLALLTSNHLPAPVGRIALASWETLIGVGFISGRFQRTTLVLLFCQMLGTLVPLAFFPAVTFTHFPYAPTLEGQYIIKNVVLISAGLVIGATVRGGRMISEPRSNSGAPSHRF